MLGRPLGVPAQRSNSLRCWAGTGDLEDKQGPVRMALGLQGLLVYFFRGEQAEMTGLMKKLIYSMPLKFISHQMLYHE